VRRADVVLIVCDAEQGLSEQDVRIAGYAHEQGKASVLLVNKWDLIEKDTYTVNRFKETMGADLAFMSYVPMLFLSAKTGQRVNKVLDYAAEVYDEAGRRVPTGTLNDVLGEAIAMQDPPSDKGRQLKIYYATQASTRPPTFIVFVNDPELVHFSYQRYLENFLRKSFDLNRTPIRIWFRSRKKEEA